jgi:hypothetical protein
VRPALLVVLLALPLHADALTVLTVGKKAVFRAGGGAMALQVAAYPQALLRVDAQERVALPCDGWSRRGASFVYRDRAGAHGGVRKVVYSQSRLLARFEGGAHRHVAGPVGYAELWIEIGGARLLARFNTFRKNDARLVVSRKPSAAAAAGEAGFWTVIHGDAHSVAEEEETIANLTKAMRRDREDGRPPFLLGMLHLYRFGQATVRFDQVTDAARADLVAANAAFATALPLNWDGIRGDSRVPGFIAAAKFTLGIVQDDAALQAEGLADLEAAVAINSFFNVFDLIPVVQALPADDPRFAQVFPLLRSYIGDPETLSCVVSQPEICADAGLAPRNVAGALMLFGDVFVKAGALDPANVVQAETFYYPIAAVAVAQTPGYRFAAAAEARVGPGKAAARAALYADGDPTNDPPIIGAGPEACAVCHYR